MFQIAFFCNDHFQISSALSKDQNFRSRFFCRGLLFYQPGSSKTMSIKANGLKVVTKYNQQNSIVEKQNKKKKRLYIDNLDKVV